MFGESLGSVVLETYERIQPEITDYKMLFGNIYTDSQFVCYVRAIARYRIPLLIYYF